MQLFPAHRGGRKFGPRVRTSIYTSAHTICLAELFSLEELFQTQEKLPSLGSSQWPLRPPGPCPLLWPHLHLLPPYSLCHSQSNCAYFSFSSSAYSLLLAVCDQAVSSLCLEGCLCSFSLAYSYSSFSPQCKHHCLPEGFFCPLDQLRSPSVFTAARVAPSG